MNNATEMPPVRFALVGCGRISRKHVDAVTAIPSARLVAVCDEQPDRARRVGETARVPWFDSYDRMLSAVDCDVVSILTPSGLHAAQTTDIATRFRRHIVCEKPMALRLEDADRMIESCDRAGVRLFVVKQNRYNLPVQRVRQALDAGRFGRLVLGTVRVRWCRDQTYYDQDPWRGKWRLDGGVLANQASHHIDLLEWMLGEPASVMAKMGTYLVNIEVEDTAAAIIKFRNGALGIVEATTATRPRDLEGSLSILGEKGSVVVGGFAVNRMETWSFEDETTEQQNAVLRECAEAPPNVYGFGHERYLEHVIQCIREGTRALVDGLEGRKSLELINAIYESAETGREVSMRFEPKMSRLGRDSG